MFTHLVASIGPVRRSFVRSCSLCRCVFSAGRRSPSKTNDTRWLWISTTFLNDLSVTPGSAFFPRKAIVCLFCIFFFRCTLTVPLLPTIDFWFCGGERNEKGTHCVWRSFAFHRPPLSPTCQSNFGLLAIHNLWTCVSTQLPVRLSFSWKTSFFFKKALNHLNSVPAFCFAFLFLRFRIRCLLEKSSD